MLAELCTTVLAALCMPEELASEPFEIPVVGKELTVREAGVTAAEDGDREQLAQEEAGADRGQCFFFGSLMSGLTLESEAHFVLRSSHSAMLSINRHGNAMNMSSG